MNNELIDVFLLFEKQSNTIIKHINNDNKRISMINEILTAIIKGIYSGSLFSYDMNADSNEIYTFIYKLYFVFLNYNDVVTVLRFLGIRVPSTVKGKWKVVTAKEVSRIIYEEKIKDEDLRNIVTILLKSKKELAAIAVVSHDT